MTMPGDGTQFGERTERFFGLYPGIAANVVDGDGLGRITVRLPWISETYETRPAPVAQLYAGDGYGAVWLPEEGDQVVVAFIKGQLARPVVLGSIYARSRRPSSSRSDGADPKLMRTKGGHYLLMEDGTGRRIELVDLTGGNRVVIDSEANSVTLEATGDVTLKAGANLAIEAGGNVTITAGGQVAVSGATISLN